MPSPAFSLGPCSGVGALHPDPVFVAASTWKFVEFGLPSNCIQTAYCRSVWVTPFRTVVMDGSLSSLMSEAIRDGPDALRTVGENLRREESAEEAAGSELVLEGDITGPCSSLARAQKYIVGLRATASRSAFDVGGLKGVADGTRIGGFTTGAACCTGRTVGSSGKSLALAASEMQLNRTAEKKLRLQRLNIVFSNRSHKVHAR
jgi:hypothetical protein